jgi:hypothetical protein
LRRRAQELVLYVELPGAASVDDVQLAVARDAVSVCVPAAAAGGGGGGPPLEVRLPHAVDEAASRAKFDAGARRLTVTMPVRPAPREAAERPAAAEAGSAADGGTAVQEQPGAQQPRAPAGGEEAEQQRSEGEPDGRAGRGGGGGGGGSGSDRSYSSSDEGSIEIDCTRHRTVGGASGGGASGGCSREAGPNAPSAAGPTRNELLWEQMHRPATPGSGGGSGAGGGVHGAAAEDAPSAGGARAPSAAAAATSAAAGIMRAAAIARSGAAPAAVQQLRPRVLSGLLDELE